MGEAHTLRLRTDMAGIWALARVAVLPSRCGACASHATRWPDGLGDGAVSASQRHVGRQTSFPSRGLCLPGMGKQQHYGGAHVHNHVGNAAAVLEAVDYWTHSAKAPEERPREHANGARASARDERRAAANTQLVESLRAVLQPGAEVYDGYGVARPSVFVLGGPRFRAKLAAVMADRGGPGSWMWQPVPKDVLHQGVARQQGGRAAELAAEKRQKEAAKGEAQRLRERKAREKARLKSVADQFRASSGVAHIPAGDSDVLDAREAALQAYRQMKSRQVTTGGVSKRR